MVKVNENASQPKKQEKRKWVDSYLMIVSKDNGIPEPPPEGFAQNLSRNHRITSIMLSGIIGHLFISNLLVSFLIHFQRVIPLLKISLRFNTAICFQFFLDNRIRQIKFFCNPLCIVFEHVVFDKVLLLYRPFKTSASFNTF